MYKKKKHLVILLFVGIAVFFMHNRVLLTDIMESRNIVTAREMVYDGHWIVPTMNGELRLEKPPLPTWIAAFSEMLHPDSIAMQRSMAGIAALFLVFFFYRLGHEITLNRKFAFLSSLVLLTSYNIIYMGRTATWDIYCHTFMLAAIYHIYMGLKKEGRQWGNLIPAGIYMGLSFMSKGPVSFYALLLPFLIVLPILKTNKIKGKFLPIGTMIIIALVLSSWWYILLYVAHADAFNYVFNKETTAWTNHNVRPWYYYWKFFFETGVWSFVLITALSYPLWKKYSLLTKRKYLFAILWIITQLILLSLLPEKKNRYLMPILIPAAYIVGGLVTYWQSVLYNKTKEQLKAQLVNKVLFQINMWIIAFAVFIVPIIIYFVLYKNDQISLMNLSIISVLMFMVVGYLSWAALKLKPLHLVYSVVVLFLLIASCVMPYIANWANNPEYYSISNTRNISELKDVPFYTTNDEIPRIELVYESHKKIHPLSFKDSVAFSQKLPLVILTHKKLAEDMPASLYNSVETKFIGHFDDNRRPKSNKHHHDFFEFNVYLLKQKK